jgi:hypothetical protein
MSKAYASGRPSKKRYKLGQSAKCKGETTLWRKRFSDEKEGNSLQSGDGGS